MCANHVSNFDYLYLTLTFRKERLSKLCCMAKQELFQSSWLNRLLCRVGGMVPIDRTGAVGDSMHALAARLKEKWGVLAFPEGTRSKDGRLAAFKKGPAMLAVQTGVPIVPVCIKGALKSSSRGTSCPTCSTSRPATGTGYRCSMERPSTPPGKPRRP
ncbi:MAG: 1-acyl-sn-glycerol-3-phosphate acyltransferase [Clostridiales bacterium]|nr:1-acyl-sn-glycerol-3-phosphate acyltransferase [Clostridiales bacterium]